MTRLTFTKLLKMKTLLGLGATTGIQALSSTGQCEESPWQTIAPLPDKTGFSGHFGATLEGHILIGGGSNFDRPLWLEGKKSYSDHLYLLTSLEDEWQMLNARLPYPIAHAAFASDGNSLYLAGGTNHEGVQSRVFKITLDGNESTIEELPPMPQANCYGAGAVAGGYFYVIGGDQNEAATACWRLPIDGENWERLPDLPGPPAMLSAASAAHGQIYFFGGISYPKNDAGEKVPTPLNQAYCFNPETNTWAKLSDMPAPRVAACASPALFSETQIMLAGGFAISHPGSPETHPGFDDETLIYDITRDHWTQGPPLPVSELETRDSAIVSEPQVPLAAPLLLMDDHLVLISGEVLPSVRMDCVLVLPLDSLSVNDDE